MSTNPPPTPQQPPPRPQGYVPLVRPAADRRRGLELWQWMYIGAGVVILLAIIVTTFYRGAQPTPAASSTAAKQWVTIQHFTGSQSMQTYAFHVAKGNRILWIATPTSPTNTFTMAMSTSDASVTTPVAKAANISSVVSQTYTVHGDYDVILTISAASVTYDIRVQASQ